MSDISNTEIIDAAAFKIAIAQGCGFILDNGEVVLCCDPRAGYLEEQTECSCWNAAREAAEREG